MNGEKGTWPSRGIQETGDDDNVNADIETGKLLRVFANFICSPNSPPLRAVFRISHLLIIF